MGSGNALLALPPLVIALVLSACSYYIEKGDPRTVEEGEIPSFEFLHTTIFKPKCAGCHNEEHKSGFDATTYETLMQWVIEPGNPDASMLFASINDNMPPNPKNRLSAEEIESVRLWIEAGATKQPEKQQ